LGRGEEKLLLKKIKNKRKILKKVFTNEK